MNPMDIENEIHERISRLVAKINALAKENMRLTAEKQAQAKRIKKLEDALKTIRAYSMDYQHMTGTVHRDMEVIFDAAKQALALSNQALKGDWCRRTF